MFANRVTEVTIDRTAPSGFLSRPTYDNGRWEGAEGSPPSRAVQPKPGRWARLGRSGGKPPRPRSRRLSPRSFGAPIDAQPGPRRVAGQCDGVAHPPDAPSTGRGGQLA